MNSTTALLAFVLVVHGTFCEAAISEDDAAIDITEPWHDLLFGSGRWSRKDSVSIH